MRVLGILLLATVTGSSALAQGNTTDTRMLAQPAVSATRIAFSYAGDLWTARLLFTSSRADLSGRYNQL